MNSLYIRILLRQDNIYTVLYATFCLGELILDASTVRARDFFNSIKATFFSPILGAGAVRDLLRTTASLGERVFFILGAGAVRDLLNTTALGEIVFLILGAGAVCGRKSLSLSCVMEGII
jgi:hypothetical protein